LGGSGPDKYITEIKTTIKKNPNKTPMFKNVLQYLKQPRDSFLIYVPIDIILGFEPLAQFLPKDKELTRDIAEKALLDYLDARIKEYERYQWEALHEDDWK